MKGNKLYIILESLTAEEMRALKKAVQSPLFNSNKTIERLFDILRTYHPNYPDTVAFKQKIFGKLFPEEKYKDQKLRGLFTQLRTVVEQLLLHLEISGSPKEEYLLATIYKKRKLPELYRKKLDIRLAQMEAQPLPDTDMLRDKIKLLKELAHFKAADFNESQAHLKRVLRTLNQYFIAERNEVLLDFKVIGNTISIEESLPYQSLIAKLSEDWIQPDNRNHFLYQKLLNLFETRTKALLLEIQSDFLASMEGFSTKDRQDIFGHLVNFCVQQINRGVSDYNFLLFELYKTGLEKSLLLSKVDSANVVWYKNISIQAMLVREYDWAANFLEEYEWVLNPGVRKNMKILCFGYLHFFKKDFDKTIEHLLNYKFFNINNVLSARGLLIRCYFELFLKDHSYFQLFDSYASAHYNFLKRHQLSKTKKKMHQNLVTILRRIAKHLYGNKDVSGFLESVKKDIESERLIIFKAWLNEKIEDTLKKGNYLPPST